MALQGQGLDLNDEKNEMPMFASLLKVYEG